jgi:WD40 repeat protein
MLYDASRFTLHNRNIIDEAPLQLYMSALLLAPRQSIIRQTFGDVLRRHLDMIPMVLNLWGAESSKLEGHGIHIASVAFSHDGRLVASGSKDKTVGLSMAKTSERAQKVERYDMMSKVSEHWDARPSKLLGHRDFVSSVA